MWGVRAWQVVDRQRASRCRRMCRRWGKGTGKQGQLWQQSVHAAATQGSSHGMAVAAGHPLPPGPLSMSTPASQPARQPGAPPTCTTVAVRPAAEEPLPEVYTAMGATLEAYLRNWDLAVEGSPRSSTLTSPRRVVPSGMICEGGGGSGGWGQRVAGVGGLGGRQGSPGVWPAALGSVLLLMR